MSTIKGPSAGEEEIPDGQQEDEIAQRNASGSKGDNMTNGKRWKTNEMIQIQILKYIL